MIAAFPAKNLKVLDCTLAFVSLSFVAELLLDGFINDEATAGFNATAVLEEATFEMLAPG